MGEAMNHLSKETVEKIKEVFLSGVGVRMTAVTCAVSRNSVRKILRAEGLCCPKAGEQIASSVEPKMSELDFKMLERLFELGRERPENLDFKEDIVGLAKSITTELGITGTIDKINLQGALFHYIIYRRFYFRSLHVSEMRYDEPFERRHEKCARAALDWVKASHEAHREFRSIVRELEVKYGKRLPHFGGRSVFIQNQIGINQSGAPTA